MPAEDCGQEITVADAVVSWWRTSTTREERSTLPWRLDPLPWRVLVSEVMLAQTPVTRVRRPFEEFVRRYPSPAVLAAASLGEVLALWSGLGYPRRARALFDSARLIVERHEGEMPRSEEDLLALPGVGAYTARAVLAFAFDEEVLPIDTNVGRFLARAVAGERTTARRARRMAAAMAHRRPGRELASAVMDHGATYCRPRPRCEECPLAATLCRWQKAGRGEDPAGGSFAVSRAQAPYAGSDREVRGRVLRLLSSGGLLGPAALAEAGCAETPERAGAAARSLVSDGLLVEARDRFRFPG